MKNGGQVIEVPRQIERHPLSEMLVSWLEELNGGTWSDAVGMVVVAWNQNTEYCTTCVMGEGPVSPTLLPAFVAEALRRDYLGPLIVAENLD